MARYDDLNTSIIAYSAILSSFVLLAIILAVLALSYGMESAQLRAKTENAEYVDAEAVQREQRESINGSIQWVQVPAINPEGEGADAEPTKRLQIPIDRAIELTIKKFGDSQSAGNDNEA